MENQPNKPNRYFLEWNGRKIELVPGNTTIYQHSIDRGYDHFYVELNDEEDEEPVGYYEWRESHIRAGNEAAFDERVADLQAAGCFAAPNLDYVSNLDKERFMQAFGTTPTVPEYVEPEPIPLTPRVENFIAYFGYLLLNGHITAEEFCNGSGDLRI